MENLDLYYPYHQIVAMTHPKKCRTCGEDAEYIEKDDCCNSVRFLCTKCWIHDDPPAGHIYTANYIHEIAPNN